MSFITTPISLFSLRPQRRLGEIALDVIINESATDTLNITKQPVQQGASITDHAFMEPTQFKATVRFKDNLTKSLSKIYQELLDLQKSRVPFNITTPKRIYYDMLISSLGQTTDKTTENVLSILISCQQALIVNVTTVQVPRSSQANPGATGKTENAGQKSAIFSLKEGIGG